jgi:aspartate dehydrogenase
MTLPTAEHPLRVGIAGLGNIGTEVVRWLSQRAPASLGLAAVAGRSPDALRERLDKLDVSAPVVSLEDLPDCCEVLVDCLAPEASLAMLAHSITRVGTIVPVSVGVLLLHPELIERARAAGTRLLIPSGAVAGLDILRAAALGTIHSVRIRTSKPPAGVDAQQTVAAHTLFRGSANDALARWPRNLNVAATLALAGIGGERTEVEIRVDPTLQSNVHEIDIDSDSTQVSIRLANRPSPSNPASSAITALSVCAVLQGLVEPVRFGT